MSADPDFETQRRWLGPCSAEEIRCRAEDELDSTGRRSLRRLIGILIIGTLLYVLAWQQAMGAEVTWGCIKSTEDVYGKPLTLPVTYSVALRSVDSSQLLTQEIECTNPVSVVVPDPPGLFYTLSTTAINAAGPSYPSNGLRLASASIGPPKPKMLLTVGGDVWIASPTWVDFKWKATEKAGTIPPKVKCDPTRHIPPDLYRVVSPITWTAGKKNYVVARCIES
jgi:hypothetical protein